MATSSYLHIALKAAGAAAEIHKRYFNNDAKVRAKSSHFNLLTQADLEAEQAIARIIKNEFPDHNIIGEENQYERTSSPYSWIVDPLDGTNNFAHGLPIFSVSIALAKDNEPIIGIVFDPMRDELFKAVKNEGAYLNDKKIKVSGSALLKQSLLITGFYYDRSRAMKRTLDDIYHFFSEGIIGLRRLGSAALDLCYVASGRADGFWEFLLNPWDFAAGSLILREAGGKITDFKGRAIRLDPTSVLASNGHIHDQMLEVLHR
ncbi:MAG: inositol monophosphatase [Spirochaetales bacterium]|nr:inositol monophosphatase [Spirochaetales bacterium]